jgi:CRP/FNR family transcriptional regulator, cyclic AMP receptor protein
MEHKLDAMKACPLFQGFDDAVLERFAASAELKRYKTGDIIFVEMSEGPEVFLIASGEVSIRVALANEDEHYDIVKLGRGEVLGEVSFIDEVPRSGTAIAQSDVETLVWDSGKWREICEADFEVGYQLTLGIAKILCARLRRWNIRILDNVDWGIV